VRSTIDIPSSSFAFQMIHIGESDSVREPSSATQGRAKERVMAAPNVLFLNGPNANLYGLDAKGTYGTESFPEIEARCRKHAGALGLDLNFRQSNHKGVLIDWIQDARQSADGLIINGAGLTYTSIAILDALLAFEKPILEVHMSNIYRREPFRHHSYISKAATGIVAGLGPMGYELAITAMSRLLGGDGAA
jgi:3-dehydroquinate dehydratase II